MMTETVAYGHWPSPLSAEMLTEGVVGLVDVFVDGASTVWLEGRPSEGGRQVLVLRDGDLERDVVGPEFNARSAVHEYGGGAAWVANGTAWFVNWADQRIWRVPLDGSTPPAPVSPDAGDQRTTRYADMRVSADGRWLVAVRERHVAGPGEDTVLNDIVVLAGDGSGEHVVFGDTDFVAAPRWLDDDDGRVRLRWIAWDHPNMPWNETRLYECEFASAAGVVGRPHLLVAGAALMQPVGEYVLSDRTGYWNIWNVTSNADDRVEERQDTFGQVDIGGPAWVFGDRAYGVLADGRLAWATGGALHVAHGNGAGEVVHDGESGSYLSYDTGGTSVEQLAIEGFTITAIVRFPDRPAAIVRFEIPPHPAAISDHHPAIGATIVRPSDESGLSLLDVSHPQAISYPTADSATAYGWFYPPTNSAVTAPPDTRPPLLVFIHGGPTSRARPWFSLATQFWTTRGFAVVDVDHRGSSGYGTAFRNLLDGQWGVVDVEDCAAAATYLAAEGLVDGNRVAIRGGSAGGFTVLGSLATTDVYAAGASLYGVADLTALANDTHKFEARYLDRMIGPWPEARAVYEARSPINRLDGFDTPLIVFQGLDDKVVPPNQSEMIVDALRTKGVECEYHAYEGEGHGFRKAATIVDELTNELAFYRRVMLH